MKLIDKEHALEFFALTSWGSSIPTEVVGNCILNFEEIDAQPVIHARWIKDKFKDYCSNCGADYGGCYNLIGVKYCYHCGAKMDEE